MNSRQEHTNPMFTAEQNLEMAIGSIDFRDKVIINLRIQLINLREMLRACGVDDMRIDARQFKHLRENQDVV